MKKNALELVFILDRSGSMYSLTDDAVGGFNSVLDQQKKENTDIVVTTVLFNNRSVRVHDRVSAADVPHITREDYNAGGSTALYDAVGSTIDHIEKVHHYIRPEDVPEKTLFVITTDGMENASNRYSREQVKERIKQKKTESGWEFLFLAANIDTQEVAEGIGIDESRTASFQASSGGIRVMYQKLNSAIDAAARFDSEEVDWKEVLRDKEKIERRGPASKRMLTLLRELDKQEGEPNNESKKDNNTEQME